MTRKFEDEFAGLVKSLKGGPSEGLPPGLFTCRDPELLMKWWAMTQNGRPVLAGRYLFAWPRKGYVTAVRDSGAFAANRAAMLRSKGDARKVYKLISNQIFLDLCEGFWVH